MGRITFVDGTPPVNLDVCVVLNRGLEVVSISSSKEEEEEEEEEEDLLLWEKYDKNDDKEDHEVDVITTTTTTRIVRATRDLTDIGQYEPLLREYPALVCESGHYMDYIEQFLDVEEDVQLGILDMYYQPLTTSPMGRSVLEPAFLLYQVGILDDMTVLQQLLCILLTNGCQYKDTQSALAIFGSKFSHSCTPNAAYSSTASDGCLEYILLLDGKRREENDHDDDDTNNNDSNIIRMGEEVTFSYISDLLETATPARRDILWTTKFFVCMCPRCMGPDYCRVLPCPHCQHLIPCRYRNNKNTTMKRTTTIPNESKSNNIISKGDYKNNNVDECTSPLDDWEVYWECPKCCQTADVDIMLHYEREIERTLKVVSRQIESQTKKKQTKSSSSSWTTTTTTVDDDGIDISPILVREIIDECCEILSTTHHLTIKALRLLVTVSTAKAYEQMTEQVSMGLTSSSTISQTNNGDTTTTDDDDNNGRGSINNINNNIDNKNKNENRNLTGWRKRLYYEYQFKMWSFVRTSVLAGIQLVLACECVAANCTGCYLPTTPTTTTMVAERDDDPTSSIANDSNGTIATSKPTNGDIMTFHIHHTPQYDRCTPMRHVCENLLLLPLYLWPSDGITMVQRYLPALKAKFKDILKDEIGKINYVIDNLQCVECCTADDNNGRPTIVWDGRIESLLLYRR